MASGDARPIPRKNVAYRVTFPILDADGDLVSGASDLDSEVSLDGGTFADCTNEATEIATSSGVYYLDLTSDEMNADTVAILVKTSTEDAKTTVIVLYPEELGDFRVEKTGYGLADDAISEATRQAIADELLKRGVSNVEDEAGALTIAELILSVFESSRSGTTWTIRKSGGSTFSTRTLTVDSDADPVTGVT